MISPEIDWSQEPDIDNTHYRYRSRVRVFQECKPLYLLGNTAQFSLHFDLGDSIGRQALRDGLRRQSDVVNFNLTLFSYWFEGRLNRRLSRVEIEIGCPPLLSALAGNRDRWPMEVYQEANFMLDGEIKAVSESFPPEKESYESVETTEAPEFGNFALAERPLGVLPRQLWATTLVVDGLHRAPWSAFSGVKLDFHILVGLSGVFTIGAYLYALVRCGAIKVTELTGHQQELAKCIRDRDAAHLVDTLSVPEIVEFVGGFYSWRDKRKHNLRLPKRPRDFVGHPAECLYAAANKLSNLSIMTDLLKVEWNE